MVISTTRESLKNRKQASDEYVDNMYKVHEDNMRSALQIGDLKAYNLAYKEYKNLLLAEGLVRRNNESERSNESSTNLNPRR